MVEHSIHNAVVVGPIPTSGTNLTIMHKYLQISDQEKIHYLEFGSGESLILLPSLCLTSFSYASFGEKLGNNFHVLIPDLYRGHSIYTQNAYQLEDYVEKLNQFM